MLDDGFDVFELLCGDLDGVGLPDEFGLRLVVELLQVCYLLECFGIHSGCLLLGLMYYKCLVGVCQGLSFCCCFRARDLRACGFHESVCVGLDRCPQMLYIC